MQQSHKALWDNCLKLIRQNVSEQTYKTWFEPIVFESYNETEKTVLVQLPSPYIYEYLEQHYVKMMGWALAQSFKTRVRLSYRMTVDKEHNIQQKIEPEEQADIEEPQATTRGNKAPTVLDAALQSKIGRASCRARV